MMTEALTKKATDTLDQATAKDSIGSYEIALKLYCDGIGCFKDAMRLETNKTIKQQMADLLKEHTLRRDYLNRCLNEDKCNCDDIVPMYHFQHGMVVRMSVISDSLMECAGEDEAEECLEGEDEEEDADLSAVEEHMIEGEEQGNVGTSLDDQENAHHSETSKPTNQKEECVEVVVPKTCCCGFF